MKGERYLTRPQDFARVHGQCGWTGGGLVGMKSCSNELDRARYGFIVSRRVGKAVVRNRVKRRLREILRRLNVKAGTDTIISARPPAACADFETLKKEVTLLLARAGLIVQDDKKDCSGND